MCQKVTGGSSTHSNCCHEDETLWRCRASTPAVPHWFSMSEKSHLSELIGRLKDTIPVLEEGCKFALFPTCHRLLQSYYQKRKPINHPKAVSISLWAWVKWRDQDIECRCLCESMCMWLSWNCSFSIMSLKNRRFSLDSSVWVRIFHCSCCFFFSIILFPFHVIYKILLELDIYANLLRNDRWSK